MDILTFVPFLVAYLIAFLVEAVTEYFVSPVFEKIPKLTPYKGLLVYIAALIGVGLCIYYKIDLVALIIQQLSNYCTQLGNGSCNQVTQLLQPTIVGEVLTGVLMGRGSNVFHQFVSKFLPSPKNRLAMK